MHWLTRNLLKVASALTILSFLSVLVVVVPLATAEAQPGVVILTPSGVVDATPTVDATVTALNKEKLQLDVAQQQHTFANWFWNNGAALVSSLALVIAGAFTLLRYLRDQRSEREKQREDRQNELERRAEERFQKAIEGLSSEREEAKIGAAITLRTFLRPGYEQFYIQVFDLAVVHLRRRNIDLHTPEPLDTLSEALITIFKESFSLARERLTEENSQVSPVLVARSIQLDNAYLREADLEQAWMPQASLRKADLREAKLNRAMLNEADLSGAYLRGANLQKANLIEAKLTGAELRRADLRQADLRGTHLEIAFSLKNTDLRGVTGLTKEQLEACKAKGAIIDEDGTTSSPQPPVAPSPPPQQSF